MEVLVGPTFTIDVPSSPPSSPPPPPPPSFLPIADRTVPSCLLGPPPSFDADDSSQSSSSLGTPDDSDNDLSFNKHGDAHEDDGEEVQSNFHALGGSLDALEDSLPIKRGLSTHFEGKSKSFSDLSQINSVKELKKQENPFNKRRRLLIASKLSRRSAFYSWSNPQSMPLLPVVEDEDDDDGYEEEKTRQVSSPSSLSPHEAKHENPLQLRQNRVPESYAARMRLRLGSMKARSFSLADLQEHDEAEEDDNDDEAYY